MSRSGAAQRPSAPTTAETGGTALMALPPRSWRPPTAAVADLPGPADRADPSDRHTIAVQARRQQMLHLAAVAKVPLLRSGANPVAGGERPLWVR